MKKVFLKWVDDDCAAFTNGREYEHIQETCPHVKSNCGTILYTDGNQSYWQRIEREVFTADGVEWFKHTPGDPMPCDASSSVVLLFQNGESSSSAPAFFWSWDKAWNELGWRFADSAPAQPAPSDWTEYPHSTAGQTFMPKDGAGSDFLPALSGSDLNSIQLDGISSPVFAGSSGGINREAGEFKGYDDLPGPRLPQSALFDSFAWLEFLKLAAPDVAAVEDTSLPPRHRKIVNAKEDAQAAREKAEAEALAKSEQEKSDRLKRDGEALSRDFDNQHDPRMGWMA